MKELNTFRKFINESKENVDELFGMGKKNRSKKGEMALDFSAFVEELFDEGAISKELHSTLSRGVAELYSNVMDAEPGEVQKTYDYEPFEDDGLNEGTWSVGSPESRDKLAQMLTDIQMKNDSVEDMLQALKVAKKYAYKVAGSDDVFDYLDAAEAELEKGEGGFDPDYFSDHITDAILAVSKLQENDKALNEIINNNGAI